MYEQQNHKETAWLIPSPTILTMLSAFLKGCITVTTVMIILSDPLPWYMGTKNPANKKQKLK